MSKSALLLSTKLNIPRVRTSLVARPQLIKRLQEEHALTLISTPPGFGKTTLLIEWLTHRNNKAAWLSLDVDDNDPARFIAYVEAALDLARLNDGSDASDYFSAQMPDIKTVVSLWINSLNKVQHEVILIFDDYHVIQSQSVHDMITFLLEHRPPHLRLCITTRADPPLPLSKLRAQGELLEIRSSQLRFSLSETASVGSQVRQNVGQGLYSDVCQRGAETILFCAYRTPWALGCR